MKGATAGVATLGDHVCYRRRPALLPYVFIVTTASVWICDMHYVDLLSYLDFFDTPVLCFCCVSIFFLLRGIPVMYPAKSILIQ